MASPQNFLVTAATVGGIDADADTFEKRPDEVHFFPLCQEGLVITSISSMNFGKTCYLEGLVSFVLND